MIVCQVSGGLDSAVTLAQTVLSGNAVAALYVHLGNRKHRSISLDFANDYGVAWKEVDMSATFKALKFEQSKMVGGYKMMIELATLSFAHKIGALHVVSGQLDFEYGTGNDQMADEWKAYLNVKKNEEDEVNLRTQLVDLYNTSYATKIKLVQPLFHYTKAGVVKLGQQLGVNFRKTFSCQEDAEIHCGVCPFCKSRKHAFKIAKIEDTTLYVS